MKKTKTIKDSVGIRGFYRLNIVEDDNGVPKVVGDSDWCENQIANQGKVNFLVEALGSISGSSYIGYAAIGTGSTPASTATSSTNGLPGELNATGAVRAAVTPASTTYSGSTALQLTFSFASGNTAMSGNINNVGLFAVSGVNSGQIFAGNTYSSSALATNQAIQGTYVIAF